MRALDALNWFCWGGTVSLWLLMFIRMIMSIRAIRHTDRKRRT